jgi:hypothetical protein
VEASEALEHVRRAIVECSGQAISARDPIAIVAAAIVLAATALVAVLVPVRQVAKVQPAEMLKRV